MSDSELPSWMLKGKFWSTCTFRGLGSKKQAYLDLLMEGMVKKGFQLVKGIKLESAWDSLLAESSDLIFESPDEKLWIGIRVVSSNKDLRVGFADTRLTRKKFFVIIATSFLLAFFFGAISAYVISRIININEAPGWILLPIIICFTAFSAPSILYLGIPARNLRRQVRVLLVETAESMGGRKIAAFKKTTVELED